MNDMLDVRQLMAQKQATLVLCTSLIVCLYFAAGLQAIPRLDYLESLAKQPAPQGETPIRMDDTYFTLSQYSYYHEVREYERLYPWMASVAGLYFAPFTAVVMAMLGFTLRKLPLSIARHEKKRSTPLSVEMLYALGLGVVVLLAYNAAASLKPTFLLGPRINSHDFGLLPFLCVGAGMFTDETLAWLRRMWEVIANALLQALRKMGIEKPQKD